MRGAASVSVGTCKVVGFFLLVVDFTHSDNWRREGNRAGPERAKSAETGLTK